MAKTLTGFERTAFADLLANQRRAYERLTSSPFDAATAQRVSEIDAAMEHNGLGYLDQIAIQSRPWSCTGIYLDEWAAPWVTRKVPVKSLGSVTFTGTDGVVVPQGASMSSAEGLVFTTTAQAVVAGGTVSVSIQAAEAGLAGNLAAGVQLTLSAPIAGLSSGGSVDVGGLLGGAEAEDDKSLRSRWMPLWAEPGRGGNPADYINWVRATPNVTVPEDGVWVAVDEQGALTVVLRFLTEDGIPNAAQVALVDAYVQAIKPAGPSVFVLAPVGVPLDMTITGLSPDTPEVRAAITAEIADLLSREAVPGGTIILTHLAEAVSIAADENDHVLTSPLANVTHATGEIAVPGVITYV